VQAKKRACAEGLMLGLYYYFLPNVWGKGERVGKDFYFADGEEQRCVYQMYARAGLIKGSTRGVTVARNEPGTATDNSARPAATPALGAAPATTSAPVNARAAAARTVLEQAEQRVGMRQPNSTAPAHSAGTAERIPGPATRNLASDAQLSLIARLINELLGDNGKGNSEQTAAALDALGARFDIPGLAELRSKAHLRSRAATLTKPHATKLIDALKALDGSVDVHTA